MQEEQPKERRRIIFENDAPATLSQLPVQDLKDLKSQEVLQEQITLSVTQKRGRKAKSKGGAVKKEHFSFDSATRVLLFCLCEKLQMDKSALCSQLIQEKAKLEGISVKI